MAEGNYGLIQGTTSSEPTQFMKDEFPNSKSDLFAAFIERCADFAKPCGAAAMITMQSWMFLSSYEKLRASLLTHQQITSMLHLGTRAFDSIGGEVVSSTAFVLHNRADRSRNTVTTEKGAFMRLVDGSSEAEKVVALRAALTGRNKESGFYHASGEDFAAIPGSPIVYWLSEKVRDAFTHGRRLGDVANLCQGLVTADNDRFLRQWWEVSLRRKALSCTSLEEATASGARWFPYNKGGEFRKWYGNQEYVVNWEHDGAEIRVFGTQDGGRPRSRAQNTDTYFLSSFAWSDISSGTPSFRRFPTGFIHGNKGNSAFGDEILLDRLSMVMNSNLAMEILSALSPTMTNSIGDVEKMPVPGGTSTLPNFVDSLVANAKADWDSAEISWGFEENPVFALFERE